jgi:light-regulated signal transduction histidine kinase (bacteriophytochrome)
MELKRSNDDLELFAYAASHDLQEPLRMVSSYIYLIKKRLGNDIDLDLKEFMQFSVEGVQRMQELINDLLEYSRVDRDQKEFREVDLQAIVSMVMMNLQQVIKSSGAVIETDALPILRADQSQMISLFQNLLENALKFKKPDCVPVIKITKRENTEYIEIHLKDNGIGIESEHFDRIFQLFQRLNSRSKYTGTGIGLSICKKIMEKHDGSIHVASKPGRGTTFILRFKK